MDNKKKITFAQKIMASVGLGLFVGFVLSVMAPIVSATDQTILRDAWASPSSKDSAITTGYTTADLAAAPPQPDTLPAFPGAYGKAATALQGIRDSVADGLADFSLYFITSLADSGDGTFRAVFEDSITQGDYNVIVPDTFGLVDCDGTVSGRTIEMNANVDNVYYAGQLGPGSGLDVRNCRVNVHSGAKNWVLRNLSISCSGCWDLTETAATGYYGLSFRGGTNIYIDHSRFRWNRYMQFNIISQDGDVDVDGVTFSNSMVYDADSIQGGGQSAQTLGFSFGISGTPDNYDYQHILGFQNFSMNTGWRNPVLAGDSLWWINNVCFNNSRECAELDGVFSADLIGNVSRKGGYTGTGSYPHEVDVQDLFGNGDSTLYASSLRSWRNGSDWTVPDDSLWRGSKRSLAIYGTDAPYTEGDTLPLRWKRASPLPQNYFAFTAHTPNNAWLDSTLAQVGPSRKVDSLGNWTYVTSTGANIRTFRDSVRIKAFTDSVSVNLGNGFALDTVTFTPDTMRTGAPIGDLDGDGLPNAFEKLVRGSTDSTSLKSDSMTASGYLVWELYADGKLPSWSASADTSKQLLSISGRDVRVSYVRFWADTFGLGVGGGARPDNAQITDCKDCMIDHLSIHGGLDNVFSMTPLENTDSIQWVTLQNNIIANTYNSGMLIDRTPGVGPLNRVTLYRNYTADLGQRRPDVVPNDTAASISIEKIEDVDHGIMNGSWFSRINGRVYIDLLDNFISRRSGQSYTDIWVLHECEDFGNPPCSGQDNRYPDVIYSDGNTNRDGSKTDYTMWKLQTAAAIPDSVKRTERYDGIYWPASHDAYSASVTMDSSHAEFVIDSAGANARLSCGGTFVSNRDALDDSTAARFTNATGQSTTADEIGDFFPGGNFPSLAAGTACTDTDGDGLPDAFETWSGITKADSTVANEPYLAIEYYLNGDSVYLATLLGIQPPETNATWNNLHRVRNAGVTVTQRVIGTDTITLGIFPEPTDLPPGGLDGYSFIINSDTSESLVFSCDSTSGGAVIMDSVPADSNVNAWGYDPNDIRNRTISGCP